MPNFQKVWMVVTDQIFIKGFMMSKANLIKIIESSYQWKEIVLTYWFISEFGSEFTLDKALDYKIETLNLYGTWYILNPTALNEPRLKLVLEGMKNTNLVNQLQTVEVYEKWYPSKKVQALFNQYGFNAKVIGKKDEPVEAK